MSDQETVISSIHEIIQWLEANRRTQDVSEFCIALDRLAILSFNFAESVSEAYATMNTAEEDYKAAMARSVAGSKESAAKAERMAEVEHAALKKEFIVWKNLYQKLRLKMDWISAILDHHKQRISFLKQEIRNTPSNVI